MTLGRIIALLLLASVLVAVIWQRSALASLRRQSRVLQSAQEEAGRLVLENRELSQLRAKTNTTGDSGGVSLELLRLRNEVGQLWAQRSEWEALKAANERLAEDIRSGNVQDFSKMEGFVAKEAWNDAGFGSPEAVLQTFFWAMREANIPRIAQCFPAKEGQFLAMLDKPEHTQERERTLADFQQMTQCIGYRVVEKSVEHGYLTRDGVPVSNEAKIPVRAVIVVQAAAGGAVIPFSLKLYPEGWKIKEF
jgi:hypothetical protein